jgi:hypothetical protein
VAAADEAQRRRDAYGKGKTRQWKVGKYAMSDEAGITSANADVLYRKTDDVVADACWIVEESRRFAHVVVDQTLVRRNWALGKRIAEEELGGAERADYGDSVIVTLARELTHAYGRGFGKSLSVPEVLS